MEPGQRPELQEGALEAGKQVGLWKRFHDSGQLLDEGRDIDGRKAGVWKSYGKDGKPSKEKSHR